MPPPLPFLTRLWFAWVCFFRVLFNGVYAGELYAANDLPPAPAKEPALPEAAPQSEPAESDKAAEPVEPDEPAVPMQSAPIAPATQPAPVEPTAPIAPFAMERAPTDAALQLLALFQREGRLIDFLEEDVASFNDADIGAAARVVHAGCRKALRDHIKLEAVRAESEGARVTLPEGFNADEVKLTGNVQGTGPHTGTLAHRGWKVASISLPETVGMHDAHIVAQAEVEL